MAMSSATALVVRTPPKSPAPSSTPQYSPRTPRYPLNPDGRLSSNWVTFSLPSSSGTLRCCFHSSQLYAIHPLACERVQVGPTLMLLYPSRSLAFSSLSALLSLRSWQFPRGLLALTTTRQPFSSAASAASAGRSPETWLPGFAQRAPSPLAQSLPTAAEYGGSAVSDGRALTTRERRGRADDGGRSTPFVGLDSSRASFLEEKALGVTTSANGVLNVVSREDHHESLNGATNEAPSDADTSRAAAVDINRETRPMRFDEVIGQDKTVDLLKAAVADNQVVSAYLFKGPYGTGKTSAARILASALHCSARKPGDGNPCGGKCASCRAVADGTSEVVVEIDAASKRGVAVARKIVDDVKKTAEGEAPPTTPPATPPTTPPTTGGTRIVHILDECHMLTRDAWATLLDTLEKPVGDPVFILVTTDPEQVPGNIKSRCQELEFLPVHNDVMVKDLRRIAQMKRWQVSGDGLRAIAEEAAGSMRDAKKILQQLSLLKKRITGDLVLDHFGRLPQWKAGAMLVHALSDARPKEVADWAADLAGRGVAFTQVLRQLRESATDALTRKHANRQLDFIAASWAEGEWGELARKATAEMTPHQRSLFTQQACIVAVTDTTATDTTVTLSFLQAWIEKLNDGRRKTIIPGFAEAFSKALGGRRVTIQLMTKESLGAAAMGAPSAEGTAAAAPAVSSMAGAVPKGSLASAGAAPSAEGVAAAAAAAATAAMTGAVSKGGRGRARKGVSQTVPEEERALVVASPQQGKGKEVRRNEQAGGAKAVPDHLIQPPPLVQSHPQSPQPADLRAAAAKAAAAVVARRTMSARPAVDRQENQRKGGQHVLQVAPAAPPSVLSSGAAGAHGSYDRSDHVKAEAGSGSLESGPPEVEHGRGAADADGWDSNEVSIHDPSQVNAEPTALPVNAGSNAASSASSSSNDISAEAVGHGTELHLVDSGITEADQPGTPAPDEETGTAILGGGGEADGEMTAGSLSHEYEPSINDARPGPISVSEVEEEADGAFVGSQGGDAVVEGPADGALVNGVVNGHVMEDMVHGSLEASVGHGIIDGGLLGDVAQGEDLTTDVERASEAVPVVAPAALVDPSAAALADSAAAALVDGAAAAAASADSVAAALSDDPGEAGAFEPVGAAEFDVEAVAATESDMEAVGAAESDMEAVGAAESVMEAVGSAGADVGVVSAAESDVESVGAAKADIEVAPASSAGADMEPAAERANAVASVDNCSTSAQAIPRVAAAEVDTGMDAAYPMDGCVGFRGNPDFGRREEGAALAAAGRVSPSRGTRPIVATASAGRGTSGSNVGGSTGGVGRMAFAPRGRIRALQPKALPSDHGALSRTDPGAESGRPVNDVERDGRFDDMDPVEAAAIALCKAFGGRLYVLREDGDREVDK
ncbi:unnamed protein product [Closterium sp. Yama58-4]|nr:unnamed protein product [Closterium sp. Yama58-4]